MMQHSKLGTWCSAAVLAAVATGALGALCGCGGGLPMVAAGAPPPAGKMAAGAPAMVAPAAEAAPAEPNTEAYDAIAENDFLAALQNPLSTFSIDVDTASYSNVRRFLAEGKLPPKDAVRIEELVNYFPYDYAEPRDNKPFAVNTEVSAAPWQPKHRLLRIGIQGKRIEAREMPARNLVFLLDVSGSMAEPNKLPLLRQSLKELVETLTEKDKVAIVVYAGASGLVLPPTPASRRTVILDALDRLQAGGSTNGGEGIQLAYRTARQSFDPKGVNRVILATDGDFNVGVTSESELVQLIEKERESGVYLSVLGYGMGNYKDSTLEKLADKGNGNYAYIDRIAEARKVLVAEAGSTLVTIAKDVKIQVEFNPKQVQAYRLIGYENRLLKSEDFNDDKKDAGEIGAGHAVTALYEVVPAGVASPAGSVDPLKYQKPAAVSETASSSEMLTLKLRFKRPDGGASELIALPVTDSETPFAKTSESFRFAASVAAFGMVLRASPHKGSASFELARSLAEGAVGKDAHGYRREFVGLIAAAARLSGAETQAPAIVGSR
jgi:Ca-activated chloride channel homolog